MIILYRVRVVIIGIKMYEKLIGDFLGRVDYVGRNGVNSFVISFLELIDLLWYELFW